MRKDFNKDLILRFPNIYEFCNGHLNKFILLLRKGVYPYEYMDSWQKLGETSLPDKEAFYSNLNMDDITDVDYRHGKKVFEEFNLKHCVIIIICICKVMHYCLQMFLKILETHVLKYMNSILLIFYHHPDWHDKLV